MTDRYDIIIVMTGERLKEMVGPVRAYNASIQSVRRDPDFIGDEWFDSGAEMLATMRELFWLGWQYAPNQGLMIDNGDGPIIARPIKISGQKEYMGIGYWKAPDFNEL